VEIDGMTVCKKVWDGKAEIEEFSVDSAERPTSTSWGWRYASTIRHPISGASIGPMRPEMNWITEQTKVKP
jgi:hypothetical protein